MGGDYGGTNLFVTKYFIKTSLDGEKFESLRYLDGAERVFVGNSRAEPTKENRFKPVYARYVRLEIKSCSNRPALKWDVLCASKLIKLPMVSWLLCKIS